MLKLIWETVGQPVRAGMGTWKLYEQMEWSTQTMLTAAAVALHLTADGRITAARGVLIIEANYLLPPLRRA